MPEMALNGHFVAISAFLAFLMPICKGVQPGLLEMDQKWTKMAINGHFSHFWHFGVHYATMALFYGQESLSRQRYRKCPNGQEMHQNARNATKGGISAILSISGISGISGIPYP